MTGIAPPFRPTASASEPDAPIRSVAELLEFFQAGCKLREGRRLGLEAERLPLLASGHAAPHGGRTGSVSAVLRFLANDLGLEPAEWQGDILGLTGSDRAIHLEPGAQVEFALGPRESATEIRRELIAWRGALERAATATGVHLVALGLQPLTPIADIGWVPKPRYPLMAGYLGARGALAQHMMKATASTQLNVDYTSEDDAGSIFRTALGVSPLVNAACANAPLEAGRPTGFVSRRTRIWEETDPARTGLLPWVFTEPWSFERWVRWTLDVPVMFVIREGRHVSPGDVTFATFLRSGSPDVGHATHADYQLHLTTLFPEVRIKQYIEIRGSDAVSVDLTTAVAALWRGVLYHEPSRERAHALVADLTPDERLALHREAGRVGPRAVVRGRPLAELLSALLDAAEAGLPPADAALLAPLRTLAASRRCPADDLLQEWEQDPSPATVLRRL